MSKVTCDMAMSLDGFTAGPNQSLRNPFGEGEDGRLTRWMVDEPEAHAEVIAGVVDAGAFIMGRNMFTPGAGRGTSAGPAGGVRSLPTTRRSSSSPTTRASR